MRLGLYDFGTVQFPGEAGRHQRDGATSALVRELGDDYQGYHQFLRERVAAFGGPPQPDDYETFAAYADAWAEAQHLVAAEAFLRNCRAFRRGTGRLDEPLDATHPLLDENYQLVSVD